MLEEKIKKLKNEIKNYNRILIAYSGGVDSTLLLKVAVDTIGNKRVVAATADSLTFTKREMETAREIVDELRIKHVIFKTREFENKDFLRNTSLRCYYCKTELFKILEQIKIKENCDVLMDGANFDDIGDYRPGSKAEEEFKICTPLKNAEFNKKDIREYSKQLGLRTYNYPAVACLASRIPYDEDITEEKIKMVNLGERFLYKFGFKNLRLRTSNKTGRIEIDPDEFYIVLNNKDEIISALKSFGYKYISLDIEGFRSGSLNEVL